MELKTGTFTVYWALAVALIVAAWQMRRLAGAIEDHNRETLGIGVRFMGQPHG